MLCMGVGKFNCIQGLTIIIQKENEKMEYIAPEEQIVKLEIKNALLSGSETAPSTGDSEEL